MGLFDYVNFQMDCPKCGERVRGFQTKDGDVDLSTVEIEAVISMHALCKCKNWIELTRVPPPVEPREHKEPATLDDAKVLGFRLLATDLDLPPNNQIQRREP